MASSIISLAASSPLYAQCNTSASTNVLRSSQSMQVYDLNPVGAVASGNLDPIAWDFDNDGDEDLVLASTSNNIVILRNEGAGTGQFVDATSSLFKPSTFNLLGLPIVQAGDTGDVTGDGIDDLVIATNLVPSGGSGIWLIEGRNGPGPLTGSSVSFVDALGAPANGPWLLGGPFTTFTGLVLADLTTDTPIPGDAGPGLTFALDGRLDIIVTKGVSQGSTVPPLSNLPGALLIGAGTVSGPFLDVSPALPASQAPAWPNWQPLPDSNWSDPTVEDFDGDGRPDIWVTGSDGVQGYFIYGFDYVWLSAAAGLVPADRFLLMPAALPGPPSGSGFNKVVIDFDQDGDLDVVTNTSNEIQVRLNVSAPGAIAFTAPMPAAVIACRDPLVAHSSLEVGDFNQDGLDDILEVNGTFLAGVVGGLMQVPNGIDVDLGAAQFGGGTPAYGTTSDFDNDGDLDVVFVNGASMGALVDYTNLLDGPQVAPISSPGYRTANYTPANPIPFFAMVSLQEATPHTMFPLQPTLGLLAVSSPILVFEPSQSYTLTLPDTGGNTAVFVQMWDLFSATPRVSNVVRTYF